MFNVTAWGNAAIDSLAGSRYMYCLNFFIHASAFSANTIGRMAHFDIHAFNRRVMSWRAFLVGPDGVYRGTMGLNRCVFFYFFCEQGFKMHRCVQGW